MIGSLVPYARTHVRLAVCAWADHSFQLINESGISPLCTCAGIRSVR